MKIYIWKNSKFIRRNKALDRVVLNNRICNTSRYISQCILFSNRRIIKISLVCFINNSSRIKHKLSKIVIRTRILVLRILWKIRYFNFSLLIITRKKIQTITKTPFFSCNLSNKITKLNNNSNFNSNNCYSNNSNPNNSSILCNSSLHCNRLSSSRWHLVSKILLKEIRFRA